MTQVPGGEWLLAWTDPLHIARRLLFSTIKEHADYARGWVLDLGCGAQPYRKLFQHVDRYISIDLSPGSEINVRGTALALPFLDSAFHTVLCSEVLEHVPEPSKLLTEVERVLKPGGFLMLTTPQTWGLHFEPLDFYRYTKHGLRYLAEKSKLKVVKVIPTCGMWATLTQRLSDTVVFHYAEGRSRWIVEGLSLLLAPLSLAGYGLDRLFGKRGDTLDHLLIAQKPESRPTF